MSSENKKVKNNNADDIAGAVEDSTFSFNVGKNGVCFFERHSTIQTNTTWLQRLVHILQHDFSRRISVFECGSRYQKLNECLAFLKTHRSFEEYLLEEKNKRIAFQRRCGDYNNRSFVSATPLKVVGGKRNGVGGDATTRLYRVAVANSKFRAQPLYFFDKVEVRLQTNNYGNYFSITWPGMYKIIHEYAAAVAVHLKQPFVLVNKIVYANAPFNRVACAVQTQQFFNITRDLNEIIYSSGQLLTKVYLEPMISEYYDNLFSRNDNKVELLMGALIEGVKQNPTEHEYTTINNKTFKEKTFSLAIKPMIFINVQ
ncbi:dbp-1 [Lambdina fiscellaria nucleopolyhedrovirus]|uniref:Dbp-1 n=1 Tax=Lambdina fiscellaria nucleopolyhedrovirus TaxID=1642929 RepID=A0A0E3Z650_9ABAC|nr:dbp-1 [Lambdina fiscellaria nucleopolyhedrovirus]AKC91746.1 dbp-1 [Lambdina fiscellaria nucleopolyhedrovirus]